MLKETKNIRKKMKQLLCQKFKKNPGQLNFERNPCMRFRYNCEIRGTTWTHTYTVTSKIVCVFQKSIPITEYIIGVR